jgi:hypothetical protein
MRPHAVGTNENGFTSQTPGPCEIKTANAEESQRAIITVRSDSYS